MWDSLVNIQGGTHLEAVVIFYLGKMPEVLCSLLFPTLSLCPVPLLRSGELVWSPLSSFVRSWYPGVYSEYMLHSFGGMMRHPVTIGGGDGKSRHISVLCGLSAPSELTS